MGAAQQTQNFHRACSRDAFREQVAVAKMVEMKWSLRNGAG